MLPGSRQSTGVPFSSLSFFFFSALTVEKTSSEAATIKRLAMIASTRLFLSDCIAFLIRGESNDNSAGAAVHEGNRLELSKWCARIDVSGFRNKSFRLLQEDA